MQTFGGEGDGNPIADRRDHDQRDNGPAAKIVSGNVWDVLLAHVDEDDSDRCHHGQDEWNCPKPPCASADPPAKSEECLCQPHNLLPRSNLGVGLRRTKRIRTESVWSLGAPEETDLDEQPKQTSDDKSESEDAERVPRFSASLGQGQRHGAERDANDETEMGGDEPPAGVVPIMQTFGAKRVDDPQIDETDDRQKDSERASRF